VTENTRSVGKTSIDVYCNPTKKHRLNDKPEFSGITLTK